MQVEIPERNLYEEIKIPHSMSLSVSELLEYRCVSAFSDNSIRFQIQIRNYFHAIIETIHEKNHALNVFKSYYVIDNPSQNTLSYSNFTFLDRRDSTLIIIVMVPP